MSSQPYGPPCSCPVIRPAHPGGPRRAGSDALVDHSLACLRIRRGSRSFAEYYGPPAPRDPFATAMAGIGWPV